MHLLRKLAYVGTRGIIDLRTDAERIEGYERKIAKARVGEPAAPPPAEPADLHRTGGAPGR